MSALPPRDHDRLAKSAALMSSDQDGEALAATRAFCRQLGKHGLSPADLLGARFDRVRPHTFPKVEHAPLLRPHQRTAIMARGFSELLNKWELGFLDSIAAKSDITPRQSDALNSIAFKIERGRK